MTALAFMSRVRIMVTDCSRRKWESVGVYSFGQTQAQAVHKSCALLLTNRLFGPSLEHCHTGVGSVLV